MSVAARMCITILFLLPALTDAAASQAGEIVDLGNTRAGKPQVATLPSTGRLRFTVLNQLPDASLQYRITFKVSERTIEAITTPTFSGNVPASDVLGNRKSHLLSELVQIDSQIRAESTEGKCGGKDEAKITDALAVLKPVTNEEDVPSALQQKAVREILGDTAAMATGPCRAGFVEIRDRLRATTQSVTSPNVRGGENLTITITKTDELGTVAGVWAITYEGEDRGKWLVTYGFAFVYNQWTPSRTYATVQVPNDSTKFVIRQNTHEALSFFPAVFFSWLPRRSGCFGSIEWACGPSAGLGFNLSTPVLFGAFAMTYNQDVNAHLGVAFTQGSKLLDQYQVGQTVSTNYTPAQLQQIDYRVNPFVAISFNFSSNPFATTPQSPSASDSTPPPAKKPGPSTQ